MTRRASSLKNTHFSITLSEDSAYLVRKYARENGMIMSDMFEKAIEEWMETRGIIEKESLDGKL